MLLPMVPLFLPLLLLLALPLLLLPPLMYIRKREVQEEVGGQNPETKPPRLGFGSAVPNSNGERWWVLVGLLERSDGGRGAARS